MSSQPLLRDLPKGIVRTKPGHLRYSSPKELRGQYVHRKVIADLIQEMPFSLRLLLPWPYEVHHSDWNKEHNCPHNLLVVSEALHSAMTSHHRNRTWNGKFKPRWSAPPAWMPLLDEEPPF